VRRCGPVAEAQELMLSMDAAGHDVLNRVKTCLRGVFNKRGNSVEDAQRAVGAILDMTNSVVRPL
jgi:hypothetical protein